MELCDTKLRLNIREIMIVEWQQLNMNCLIHPKKKENAH